MRKNTLFYWYLCIGVATLLTIVAFTPLVIPMGVYQPMIWGIPRTLWAGIVVYIFMVAVTYLGTRVHPENTANKGEDK